MMARVVAICCCLALTAISCKQRAGEPVGASHLDALKPGGICGKTSVAPKSTGAYFYKIESVPLKEARGIRGIGRLPIVAFDPAREFMAKGGKDDLTSGPLERASIYFGGHASHHEVDTGLSWSRVYVYDTETRKRIPTDTDRPEKTDGGSPQHLFYLTTRNGQPALLNGNGEIVARGAEAKARRDKLHYNFAFRPFWRTTNDGGNQWNNPKIEDPKANLYFYPGEKIIARLMVTANETLRLDIRAVRDDGATTRHFFTSFRQQGFKLNGAKTFKRVNSLDQFTVVNGARKGLEGKPVNPTKTTAKGGGWDEFMILTANESQIALAGKYCVNVRGGDTAKRYDEIFKVKSRNMEKGGEYFDITP